MENNAIFLESTGGITIEKKATPEFYLLYQQSVLLALKEQGVLDEFQLQRCMEGLVL